MIKLEIQYLITYIQGQRNLTYDITLAENNVDGLQFTRDWLSRNADKLECPDSPREGATAESPETTPAAVINTAYMELLDWDEGRTIPEVSQ